MYGIPHHEARQGRSSSGASSCMAEEGVQLRHRAPRSARTYPTEQAARRSSTPSCCAAARPRPRDLPVEGREPRGHPLRHGVPAANSARACSTANFADGKFIAAKGKNVVVIGGGDTGTDCVGTSLRHGCKSLVQFEILPRPPDAARGRQPLAAVAARSTRSTTARRRRRRSAAPTRASYVTVTKRFVGDDERQRQGAAHRRGRVGEGRRRPLRPMKEMPGHRAGLARRAGAAGDGLPRSRRSRACSTELGVELDERGNVAVDGDKMTSVPGVFAAGDMARGQSLVVWAIHEGRPPPVGGSVPDGRDGASPVIDGPPGGPSPSPCVRIAAPLFRAA